MKYIISTLYILSLFYSMPAMAQVPPRQGNRDDEAVGMGMDLGIPETAQRGDMASIFTKDGKCGLKKNDTLMMPAVYDKLDFIGGERIGVKMGGKMGVANYYGKILVPVSYDSVAYNYNGYSLLLLKKGKWGTANMNGEIMLSAQYDTILYSGSQNNYSYAVKNKQRMLLYGDKLVDKDISYVGIYENALVAKKEGKWGVLQKGAVTVPFVYDSIYLQSIPAYERRDVGYSNYRAGAWVFMTRKNGKYGLVKPSGETMYEAENDKITFDHLRHIFTIKKDSLYAIYFEQNGKHTPIEYSDVYTDGVQYITVKKKGKYGMLDYQNNVVVPFDYEWIQVMAWGGGFRVKKDGKAGCLKANGQVMIPAIYDEVSSFYASGFEKLFKVQLNKKTGVADDAGKLILPVVFDAVYEVRNFICACGVKDSCGLYTKEGKEICKAEYRYFKADIIPETGLVFSFKDSLRGIIDSKGNILYAPVLKKAGFITDEDGMVNPVLNGKTSYRYLKDKNNKYGVLEAMSNKTVVPLEYDDIYQQFETDTATFFAVRKGNKYGLVSSSNRIVIPATYDSINLDLAGGRYKKSAPQVVVKKGKLWGALGLDGSTAIPIEYTRLVKLDEDNLYKARKGNAGYQLLNGKNVALTQPVFDDIAQFENGKALSFINGMMKLIGADGSVKTKAIPMQMHEGYKTFEEMKWALINAMDDPDNNALKLVAHRMAPSEHMLYFLKNNIFNSKPLGALDLEDIERRYYETLVEIKRSWKTEFSSRASLVKTDDYTIHSQGVVTNKRTTDEAFGDSKYMEKILRNAIKINGFWISSYFMHRAFNREWR